MKTHRDPENTVFCSLCFVAHILTANDSLLKVWCVHSKMLYDDTQYPLTLAVADHAIWGINSFVILWR